MDRCCGKCSVMIDINADLYTVCEGMCAKSFHAECVSVTETDLCALSSNIIWICSPCMTVFRRMRERVSTDVATNTDTPKSMLDDISELKTTVADIVCTLSKITQTNSDLNTPHHCSTPISLLKVFDGTNEVVCSSTTQDEILDLSTEAPDNDVFALYLTNIDKCATVNDISLMVSQQLGVPLSDCGDVVKLIPKWRNTKTFDYVSFKITLKKHLKTSALDASTWPRGVKFREFVNRPYDAWKPI